MKKEFTLDDIDQFLEEMGFKWLDRQVYNFCNDKYERADIKHFTQQPFACVYLENGKKTRALMVLKVGADKFILKLNNTRADMTAAWVEYINGKTQDKQV